MRALVLASAALVVGASPIAAQRLPRPVLAPIKEGYGAGGSVAATERMQVAAGMNLAVAKLATMPPGFAKLSIDELTRIKADHGWWVFNTDLDALGRYTDSTKSLTGLLWNAKEILLGLHLGPEIKATALLAQDMGYTPQVWTARYAGALAQVKRNSLTAPSTLTFIRVRELGLAFFGYSATGSQDDLVLTPADAYTRARLAGRTNWKAKGVFASLADEARRAAGASSRGPS